MNIFPKIKNWLSQHKTITLVALSLPLPYYLYQRKQKTIKRITIDQSIINQRKTMNVSLNDYLYEIISHEEVMEKMKTCLYNVIQSSDIYETFKSVAYEVINHLGRNEEYIELLKERLKRILQKNEVSKEMEKVMKYINNDWSLENSISDFIEYVLNDDGVIDAMSRMSKECAYKAMDTQKTINEFDAFVKELLSNEELIKMIYNKAIEFFKISNIQTDSNIEYKH